MFQKALEKHTGFSDMPGEIRNKIYKFSLITSTVISLDDEHGTRYRDGDDKAYGLSPQLLQVSRKPNHEIHALLIAENKFRIRISDMSRFKPDMSRMAPTTIAPIFAPVHHLVLQVTSILVVHLQVDAFTVFLRSLSNLLALTVETDEGTRYNSEIEPCSGALAEMCKPTQSLLSMSSSRWSSGSLRQAGVGLA
jgi:hypothetical protein